MAWKIFTNITQVVATFGHSLSLHNQCQENTTHQINTWAFKKEKKT